MKYVLLVIATLAACEKPPVVLQLTGHAVGCRQYDSGVAGISFMSPSGELFQAFTSSSSTTGCSVWNNATWWSLEVTDRYITHAQAKKE